MIILCRLKPPTETGPCSTRLRCFVDLLDEIQNRWPETASPQTVGPNAMSADEIQNRKPETVGPWTVGHKTVGPCAISAGRDPKAMTRDNSRSSECTPGDCGPQGNHACTRAQSSAARVVSAAALAVPLFVFGSGSGSGAGGLSHGSAFLAALATSMKKGEGREHVPILWKRGRDQGP